MVDYFSKWPEVCFLPSVTTSRILSFLKLLFAREGLPSTIVSDNGVQFTSHEFSEFCTMRGIEHNRSSLYFPRSNGLVERFNKTLGSVIQQAHIEKRDVKECVDEYLLVYRSSPHSTTCLSPSLLLHGREMMTMLSLPLNSRPTKSVSIDDSVNKFSVGDSVKILHPVQKLVLRGFRVSKVKGPRAVELDDGRVWSNSRVMFDD